MPYGSKDCSRRSRLSGCRLRCVAATAPKEAGLYFGWPGAEPPKLKFLGHVDKGDHNTSSEVTFGTHTGTHLDAPLHFMKGGGTVGDLDINVLVGRAHLFEALTADRLTADVFESLNIPAGTERVLVRTRNSKLWAEGHTENLGFASGV